MTQIHSQDAPFRPDVKKPDAAKTEQKEGSDATFALDADDPASVDNRGGFEAAIDDGGEQNAESLQSEYSSDPSFRQEGIDASATSDEDVTKSVEADNASGIMDELEAEMDDRIEEEDMEGDDFPQPSEGSED